MGGPGEVVPIVPAAVLYDLGRGGTFANHPDAAMGRAAYDAACSTVREDNAGAGTGARVRGLKGGIGTAARSLQHATTAASLAAVNAVGSAVPPLTPPPSPARP